MEWLALEHDDVVAFRRPAADGAQGAVTVLLATGDQDRVLDVAGEILVQTGGVERLADGTLRMPPASACWLG
jgi:hypothetical protein